MKYNSTLVYRAAYATMMFFGVAMFSLGAVLPSIAPLVPGAIGLPPYLSAGVMISTLGFGFIMDRYGYKRLLVGSSLAMAVGLALLANSLDINVLRVAIFLIGAGGGVINGETSALVSDITEDTATRGRKLGVLAAAYCVGALAWTLLCAFIPGYKTPVVIAAGCMALTIVAQVVIRFPKAKPQPSDEGEKISFWSSFKLLKVPALALISILLFFQSAIEGVTGSLTTSYLGAAPEALGIGSITFSLTVMTTGMLLGRFVLNAILRKMHDIRALNVYMIIAAVGLLIIMIAPGVLWAVFTGMFLIGFGICATAPIMFTRIGSSFRAQSGRAFSIALAIALCGQLIGNFSFSGLFTPAALQAKLYSLFPILTCLLIFAVVFIASRIEKIK